MKFFDHIPQHEAIADDLNTRMARVMQHGQFINGPEVKELEQKLADYVGVKHAICCASGTDALELSLLALDLKPSDEVITTAYSYFATAEVIEHLGLKPVFVDIDPNTYNIDPAKIEAKITDKTKAILPASLFGQTADFDAINTIAEKQGIPVIEDGAQSFGAEYKGKKSGSLSAIGCTSFFPTKPLGCCGDGGACFTNDDKLAEKMRIIANHGQSKVPHIHTQIGMNSRLDTIQAAVLLSKMERFDKDMEERRRIAQRYDEAFRDNPSITVPHVDEGNSSVYAQYLIKVPHRKAVKEALTQKGVETGDDSSVPTAIYYPVPLSSQPIMRKKHGHVKADFPEAAKASESLLALPIYPGLSEQDQDKIIERVKQTVANVDRLLPANQAAGKANTRGAS